MRKPIPLNFLEKQFIEEWVKTGNALEAGRLCGFDEKQVANIRSRVEVQEEYNRLTKTALGRAEVTAERLTEKLVQIMDAEDASYKDMMRAVELLGKSKGVDYFGKETADVNVNTTVNNGFKMGIEERLKRFGEDRKAVMGGSDDTPE